ncbi:hypothetical protein F5X96DRAFT_505610 [Biscogniauxia mediterranea]|nr:hypothetical protein F5X96DRAFT_505610 [Biscogniauxia mediterranea]
MNDLQFSFPALALGWHCGCRARKTLRNRPGSSSNGATYPLPKYQAAQSPMHIIQSVWKGARPTDRHESAVPPKPFVRSFAPFCVRCSYHHCGGLRTRNNNRCGLSLLFDVDMSHSLSGSVLSCLVLSCLRVLVAVYLPNSSVPKVNNRSSSLSLLFYLFIKELH